MRFFKTPVSILVLAFAGLIVLTGLGHYATASGITPPNIIQGRDAVGAAPTVPPIVQAGFDGTDLQYMKVTSAANLTATPTIGALLSEKATRFALFNGASTGSQSTASGCTRRGQRCCRTAKAKDSFQLGGQPTVKKLNLPDNGPVSSAQ